MCTPFGKEKGENVYLAIAWLMYFILEMFSAESRKTKTKVITLANHKEHRQYSEPIKTQSNCM